MQTFLRRVLPLVLLGTLGLSSCVATYRTPPRPYGYYRQGPPPPPRYYRHGYGRPLPPPPPGPYRY